MFSSLAQYLPSALQNTVAAPVAAQADPQELPPQSTFDPTTDDEGDEDELIAQAAKEQDRRLGGEDSRDGDRRRVKSKKEKDGLKMASETLIFVRPPPSKSNHPLNLQVQLVPPNARAPSGIAPVGDEPTTPTSASSVRSMTTDSGRSTASVTRSASTRSTRSNYSTNHSSHSTTSFTSVNSDASGASSATSSTSSTSGRNPRRIIPLYNLQAHNVLTNTIVDAGTEAKVAKFQKRGLELLDLAVLEPVEVWGVRNKEAKREGMMISVDEMGTIVHTGNPMNRGLASAKNVSSFLQPNGTRKDSSTSAPSRPATPSAASSSISLVSNQAQGNGKANPSLLISPPAHDQPPPASAPAQSSTFSASQLPNQRHSTSQVPSSSSAAVDLPPRGMAPLSVPPTITPTDAGSSLSTTPTKRSGSLFGKLKFNTKRQSSTITSASASSSDATPTARQSNNFNDFGAPPPVPPRASFQQPLGHLSPTSPSSIASQNSNTPTPTPITPHNPQDGIEQPLVSPTPTIVSPRAANGPGGGHTRNLSLTNAISRSKNRLISGIKGSTNSNPTPPSLADREGGSTTIGPDNVFAAPTGGGGARGFFGKLAAGIGNNANTPGPSGNGVAADGGGTPRESTDSANSGSTGLSSIKNKFDRILNHSSSQQFVGNGGGGVVTMRASSESLRRQALVHGPLQQQMQQQQQQGRPAIAQLLHQPVIPPPTSPAPTPQVVQPPQAQTNHVTLRQLQLRPTVLGIQPTYVSAASSAPPPPPQTFGAHSQQPSSLSLASTSTHPRWDDPGMLAKVESRSTLRSETEESSSVPASNSGVGVGRRSGSKARGGENSSARNSLNLERIETGATTASTAGVLPMVGKEKALMYVWLVRRWLKKREMSDAAIYGGGHMQSASESTKSGGGGGGLFSNLVNRDRDRGSSSNVAGSGEVSKRGSWHGGATGFLNTLGSSGHSQAASSSSVYSGRRLMLSPTVGGGFEVRFEWKRAKGKKEKKEKRGRKKDREKEKEKEKRTSGVAGVVEDDNTPRPPQGSFVEGSPQKMSRAEQRRVHRRSTASLNSLGALDGSSASPTRNSSSVSSKKRLSLRLKGLGSDDGDESGKEGVGGDDDEESDAEDSETPWVCTLKIRRVAPGGLGVSAGDPSASGSGFLAPIAPPSGVPPQLSSQPGAGPSNDYNNPSGSGMSSSSSYGAVPEKDQTLRLKVGTLSQTPHHPKVVAMLKIPFPLPDVEVERMRIVPKRGLGLCPPQSPEDDDDGGESGESGEEPYPGLMLTANEIKDVVCSTGLWVAVREGFGGVGKVSRKGDGWKLRG